MNKELTLDERIQKLFESGWINEFNYLENQLQEARYLLVCLNEKYNQLTNNWNELEECIKKEMADGRSETNLWLMGCYDEDKKILDKMKEIKGKNDNI